MLSKIDERNGLVKTSWDEIRSRIYKVAPEFTKIVDELSPNKSFSLYLAYYSYGDLKGDTKSPLFPKINGGSFRLGDPNVPKEMINDLEYGNDSSPFGMLLEKKLEYFINLKELGITVPWQILSPGSFFPLSNALQNKSKKIYTPNGILTAVSGTRSVFMLPKIGCLTNHQLLQRDYHVTSSPPKSLYDHWDIFKQINNSNASEAQWKSCVVYFSKKWIDKIHNDKSWNPLKKYILELAWQKYEYEKNHIYYNIAYSLIQNKRNLKPNPYLADTACHLFSIAAGAVPGYAPVCDNDLLPLDIIQKAFVDSYGLKKYIPTLLAATYLDTECHPTNPVYYSLQTPTTLSFSPKSRKLWSTLFEIKELKHIVDIFTDELSRNNSLLSDTIISDVAKKIEFNFYHNTADRLNIIKQSEHLINADNRFEAAYAFKSSSGAAFASDAPFVRGCISIKFKNT
jgi:hypothetical protein